MAKNVNYTVSKDIEKKMITLLEQNPQGLILLTKYRGTFISIFNEAVTPENVDTYLAMIKKAVTYDKTNSTNN